MSAFFPIIIRYLFVWLVVCVFFSTALLAEIAYAVLTRAVRRVGKRELFRNIPIIGVLRQFTQKNTLPDGAYVKTAMFCPAAAAALLFPICASIPAGTGVPLLDNGGDLIQIMGCAVLSAVFVIIALTSLGTDSSRIIAAKIVKKNLCLILPMLACFASIASYFESIGVIGDTFGLVSFMLAQPFQSMGVPGIIGVAVFLFVIIAQLQRDNTEYGCILLKDDELSGYMGCQRFFIQLWGLSMPYMVMFLIAHIFFPWSFFKGTVQNALLSFVISFLNFAVFWLTLVFLRVVLVPLCWKIMAYIKAVLPLKLSHFVVPVLTVLAMTLVYYDSIKVAAEMTSF